MTNVVLVCVAGVSGTFLARRIRAIDPSIEPVVATVSSLAAVVASADVILIAPQAAPDADLIVRAANGVPTAELTPAAYGPLGAQEAVQTVHSLLASGAAAYGVSITTPSKE